MRLAFQIAVFLLAFLGVSWLIDGEPSVLIALVSTVALLGITRLFKGRWELF